MNEQEVVWEDPPAPRRKWNERLSEVVDHPGIWARVAVYPKLQPAYNAASDLKRRKFSVPHPDHEWEFVGRKLEDGTGAVYARYLGNGSSQ